MAQKRNEYLDISDEEEEVISGSEQEEGRFSRIRQTSGKRRRLNDEEDSADSQAESDIEFHDEDNEASVDQDIQSPTRFKVKKSSKEVPFTKPSSILGLTLSNSHQKKKKKTGVVYLSRIPPFMKPTALRHLLSPYGNLLRIFLTPEPSPAYQKRVKSGGNKKRSFVDGWVEFASKKKAKICAETLNGNIIGGKKGGWYHDDIWNIKYLRGFKWDDLMEQVQDEERVREGRLRAEIQQEAKERRAFLENVEQDKMQRTREEKKRKRIEKGDSQPIHEENQRPMWSQNKVKQREKHAVDEPQDEVRRVLSKIF